MHIKRFHSRHLSHIVGWLNARGLNPDLAKDLPEIGYIGFDQEMAVGVAFLRRIEGDYALIDSAITNPAAHSTIRHMVMDNLSEACIGHANKLKIKRLIVFTVDKNTAERALTHGFTKAKDQVLIKTLK